MKAILDVSAALAVTLHSAHAPLFRTSLSEAEWVAAPDLFYSETCNTIWKLHRWQGISSETTLQLARQALELVDDFLSSEQLWQEALKLAIRTGDAVYDCFYLAAALSHGATLLTADQKFAILAQTVNVKVVAPEVG